MWQMWVKNGQCFACGSYKYHLNLRMGFSKVEK